MIKKCKIDVVDILGSDIALGIVGRQISDYIDKELEICQSQTLFIINLIDVNPMDYNFVKNAFAVLIKKYKEEDIPYIVFKLDKVEVLELYTGIIDIFNLKTTKNDLSSLIQTLKEDNFTMVYIDEEDKITYVPNLNDDDEKVLKEIEEKGVINSTMIQEKFKFSAEKTYGILTKLVSSKFIFSIGGTDTPMYHSIKSIIKNEQ